jgi:hypothetical protein
MREHRLLLFMILKAALLKRSKLLRAAINCSGCISLPVGLTTQVEFVFIGRLAGKAKNIVVVHTLQKIL